MDLARRPAAFIRYFGAAVARSRSASESHRELEGAVVDAYQQSIIDGDAYPGSGTVHAGLSKLAVANPHRGYEVSMFTAARQHELNIF